MADMNDSFADVHRRADKIETDLRVLLEIYENLHKEANHQLMEERMASDGRMAGLEVFHRMVQTLRRNRDVVGSMVRGIRNLRPLTEFKIVEEEIPEKAEEKPMEAQSQEIIEPVESGPDEFPVIDAEEEPITDGAANAQKS